MVEEWQPDAIIRLKLDQIKHDFFDYIDKNIDKIDENIPVFYGHVIATLEKNLPDISDDLHDQFIDNITIRVLNTSKRSDDLAFIEKLFDYAERNKHTKKGKAIYDIMLGIRMVDLGKYPEAIEMLKKYRTADVLILPAIAYCYLVPALKTSENISSEELIRGPTPGAPVNRLKEMGIGDDPGINKIFWFMLKQAIEWFPSEREFLRIGIEKATKDARKDIREELLSTAIERFFDDMYFLRESYKQKLESRDAGGVAGIVKQMTQQYPDELEPVYYGLKLGIITNREDVYHKFRKLALSKNIPKNALLLLDFAFELVNGKQHEALACLDEIRMKFGTHHYYVTLLEYVAHDFLSNDEKKIKQAKKAIIDSIDQYCMKLLKIKDT